MGFYESVMPEFSGIRYDEGTADVMALTAETIDSISKELLKSKDGLGDVKFEDIPAAPTHFGHSRAGRQLGHHHNLAHQVVAGTIGGVKKDLEHFSTALTKAVRDANGADELSAEDLERLSRAVPTSHGENANDETRGNVLPPGTSDGSPDTATGDEGDGEGEGGTPDETPSDSDQDGEG
jgi:hypothetical protein